MEKINIIIEGLTKKANRAGHCISSPTPCVDVLCMVCIDCGCEIVVDRDSGKLYINDTDFTKCTIIGG